MSDVSLNASNTPPDESAPNPRRRFLTIATGVVGGIGAVGAAVPFIASWNPSAKAKAAGADVEVDISAIQPGQLVRVMWRSKPVWIVRRTPEVLAALESHESSLSDPQSSAAQQPEFAVNRHRSINEEYLVVVGICTHLGCSPQYMPDGDMKAYVEGVNDGFFCPCHGSKFDMAGRVFKNVPAPLNLVVPPYHFMEEGRLLIGSEAEVA